MEKKTMPVLMPDFYDEFHCVAAGCRNNCCVHPWRILINKKNYKELRALKEPKWLAEDFGRYIKRNPDSARSGDYAIATQGEGGCLLQTEDGLCRLQQDVGAQYLSVTCQSYPRTETYLINTVAVEVQKECGLTISCEEVARLLLHKPDPIQFTAVEEQYSPANFNGENHRANHFVEANGDRPLLAHYNLVRAVGIALLQNRDYTIEQRLMLLVLYLDKLTQAEAESKTDDLPAITDSFVAAVEQHMYDRLLASGGGAMGATIISNVAAVSAFNRAIDHPTIKRCSDNMTTVDNIKRTESYRTFVSDKEHFLEHLLVMEFFCKALPFTSKRSITDCAQYLVSVFAIFRFMLGAYLGEQTQLPENEFIDFVAFFGKSVLHSATSFDTNIGLIRNNGMNTLPHLLSIVLG